MDIFNLITIPFVMAFSDSPWIELVIAAYCADVCTVGHIAACFVRAYRENGVLITHPAARHGRLSHPRPTEALADAEPGLAHAGPCHAFGSALPGRNKARPNEIAAQLGIAAMAVLRFALGWFRMALCRGSVALLSHAHAEGMQACAHYAKLQ